MLDAKKRGGGKVLVGLSGGKDSITVLDLCVRVLGAENVSAFYMYLVRGLECVERSIRWCERRYGITVHFLPHWRLAQLYKNATYMPHYDVEHGRDLKQVDIEQAARLASGCDWVAYGHRQADSIERIAMLKRNRGFDLGGRRIYPLWRWSVDSVRAYVRRRRLPQPPQLSVLKRQSSGVSFREDRLLAIREEHPRDYAKMVAVFPFLPARLARYELRKGSWKQKTSLDRYRTSLKGR